MKLLLPFLALVLSASAVPPTTVDQHVARAVNPDQDYCNITIQITRHTKAKADISGHVYRNHPGTLKPT